MGGILGRVVRPPGKNHFAGLLGGCLSGSACRAVKLGAARLEHPHETRGRRVHRRCQASESSWLLRGQHKPPADDIRGLLQSCARPGALARRWILRCRWTLKTRSSDHLHERVLAFDEHLRTPSAVVDEALSIRSGVAANLPVGAG